MKNQPFEDAVVQHVLERLLKEIDEGGLTTIYWTETNQDGTSSTRTREVNVQHIITSKIIQKLTDDKKYIDKIHEKIENMLSSDDFIDKVADNAAQGLINWLNSSEGSWYDQEKFPNREKFKETVKKKAIDIVAMKKAQELLEEESN